MLGTGKIIPRLTAFKGDSNHFCPSFYFIFFLFFHVNVYMHVPTGAIVARSIDLHPPRLHLYAVKSEARIATCTFWGGGGVRTSAASTSGASCRFCPFILFYFLKLFWVFLFFLSSSFSPPVQRALIAHPITLRDGSPQRRWIIMQLNK